LSKFEIVRDLLYSAFSRDLEDVQTRAAEEVIPYQTLIASLLHKYVNGRLIEASSPSTFRSTGREKNLRDG
jgi:hypothetical protein